MSKLSTSLKKCSEIAPKQWTMHPEIESRPYLAGIPDNVITFEELGRRFTVMEKASKFPECTDKYILSIINSKPQGFANSTKTWTSSPTT